MQFGETSRDAPNSPAHLRFLALTALLAVVGLLAGACGGGLGTDKPSGVTVEGEGTQARTVPAPQRSGLQGDPLKINIKSNGESPLTIENISISEDTSDRIAYEGEDTGQECIFSESDPVTNSVAKPMQGISKCPENHVCDVVTNTCISRELPETPIELPAPQLKQFRFYLTAAETGAVDCPEAPESVPQEFKANYCGTFTIETDAPNSAEDGLIEEGTVTFYFQVDAGSGEISVEPQSISFDNVEPGTTTEKDLTIVNNGESPLEVERITLEKHRNLVSISPKNWPISIEGGNQKTWKVRLSIPSDMKKEDIPSTTTVFIESSAANTSTAKAVGVSIGAQTTAGPAIEFSKKALSFKDSKTQTVTISNTGQEKLLLSKLDLEFVGNSSGDDSSYSYKFKGQPVMNDQITDSEGIAPGESADLQITLNGPDNLKPAWLSIKHNDPVVNGKVPTEKNTSGTSKLVLMAGQDAAFGQVYPSNLNFELTDSVPNDGVKMFFVIRSLGTQPLEIKEAWRSGSEPPNFPIPELETTSTTSIPAGEQMMVTQKFLGKSGDMPAQLTAEFPGNTQGPTLQLAINATPNDNGADPQAKITPQFQGNTIPVGKVAVFSGAESSTANSDPFYNWVVLERPQGSDVFVDDHPGSLDMFALRPDVAGKYTIGLKVADGLFDDMTTMEVTAEAPSNN